MSDIKNKYKSLLGNSAIFGIGNFLTKLIYFFLMPIYTTNLSTVDFGIADLLSNSLSLITPILTLNIADGVFRFILDKDANPEKILNCGLYIISISFILITIICYILFAYTKNTYWVYFGILYITENFRILFANFTRAIGKVRIFALNGIIRAIVLISASYLLLVHFHLGINGYLIAFIIANCIASVYLVFSSESYRYLRICQRDKNLLKNMIIYCLPLVPNTLSWWFNNISSRYIIAGFCGLSIAGLFSAAGKIPSLITVIGHIFNQAWQYASVKEYQRDVKSEFYSIVFRVYSCIIILSSTIIIILVPNISKFVLKDVYYHAWVYTPCLLFSAMLGCYSVFLGTFYTIVKKNKKIMTTTLVGSILSLILSFILIPFIGSYGAIISNILGYAVVVYLRINHVKKFISLNIDYPIYLLSTSIVLIVSILMTIDYSYYLNLSIILLIVNILLQSNNISFIVSKTIKHYCE